MEFAKTIHSAGNDLLNLINDILDLSKIESGTVVIDAGEIRFSDLHDYVDRTFRHVAEAKNVEFRIDVDSSVPRGIVTDSKRLQQILKTSSIQRVQVHREGESAARRDAGARGMEPRPGSPEPIALR